MNKELIPNTCLREQIREISILGASMLHQFNGRKISVVFNTV
jgi:hypothetical protein